MYQQLEKLLASPRTFKDVFEVGATHGNHPIAFITEVNNKEVDISYDEYYDNCYKYASSVKSLLKDIECGSYVGFKANNSPKWAYFFWAILIAGYNPVIINPLYNKNDTNRLLKESNAKAIIAIKDDVYDVPTFKLEDIELGKEKLNPDTWGTKVAFCTSGTTGDSRIFVFTDKNIVAQIHCAKKLPDTSIDVMYKKDKGDLRLLAVVPFAHIYGFVGVFLWYTFFGMTIVFPRSISSQDIQYTCQKYKVTHIYGVPLLWDSLTKSVQRTIDSQSVKKQALIKKYIDCNNHIITPAEAGFAASNLFRKIFQKKVFGTHIRFCVSGGAALSKETLLMINGIGYPLNNGYGMTEIGVTSVETVNTVEQRLKGSIGFPLTDVEYKIIDQELCVKSPQIHSFTLVNGKEIPATLDSEGYFHTGDIGELDETEHAWIKGKKKDVIIGANGENIYPDEIAVKFNGVPFVDKFTVVGIKDKSDEVLTLIAYLEKELDDEERQKFSKAISVINDIFPTSLKIKRVLISKNDLPVNTSMKIVKHELIENYFKNPGDFIEVPLLNNVSFENFDQKQVVETQNKIKGIIAKLFNMKPDDIGNSQNLITDLGGDSFTYMSVIAELEKEFDLAVPSELIGRLNSVNDFTLFVLKRK